MVGLLRSSGGSRPSRRCGGRREDAVGPQDDLAVAGLPGEAHALLDQPARRARGRAPAGSTSSRRSCATVFDLRTRKTEPTISPSRSAIQQRSRFGSKLLDELGARSARPAPRTLVPAVLLGRRARRGGGRPSPCRPGRCVRSRNGRCRRRRRPSSRLDRRHGLDRRPRAGRGERGEQRARSPRRALASSGAKALRPFAVSERRLRLPSRSERLRVDQPAALEAPQHAAQVAGVEAAGPRRARPPRRPRRWASS